MTTPIHVLLVSAQAAANLLPALDPALKPLKAILLVTQKMRRQADALQTVLTESGVKTSRVALDDEHDFARLESSLIDFAAAHEGADIVLNLTGGTKLMALAAQSVAAEAGWKMFYVDVDTDEVIWLGKNAAPRQRLTAHLRLSHYLRGYGYTPEGGVDRPLPDARHNQLLDTLILQVGSLEQPLGQLNYLAQQAEDKHVLNIKMTHEQSDSRRLEALLRLFEQAGAVQVKGDMIEFASAQELAFAKGGWLEHHVFRTVTALHGELGLRDKAANLVVADASGVRNEMDVAFMARNRLYVIECKTARMDVGVQPKANDTLFKLAEICRRVGGLGTRGMLASYRPVRDSEKKLAGALNIELVCGPELARLRERLTTWVKGAGG
ncbi:MAG: Card1-like endonuclease domain-containing protein [Burkholderiaceae bacterium]